MVYKKQSYPLKQGSITYEATLNGSVGITGKANPLTLETRLTSEELLEKKGGGGSGVSNFMNNGAIFLHRSEKRHYLDFRILYHLANILLPLPIYRI
jgi:hypothetical protein